MMISKIAAVLAWLLLAAITFVTISPINLRPETGHAFLERFLTFAALGATFGIGYRRQMPFAAAVTIVAAIGLEAVQLLAPGRHARVVDAAEKVAGGLVGLVVAAAWLAVFARAQAPRAQMLKDRAP
jgi:VanZ family protein